MNKKITILIFTLIISTASLFAKNGIGVQGGIVFSKETFEESPDYICSATFAGDWTPWVASANYSTASKRISLVFDNWVIYRKISGSLNYFLFWGVDAGFCPSEKELNSGARLGGGINVFFGENNSVELFIQTAWDLIYGIKKEDSDFKFFIDPLNFPVSGGIRFWF